MTDLLPGAEPTPLPAHHSPLPAGKSTPLPAGESTPLPAHRSPLSEALEAELAMLEAILPTDAKGSPKDGGATR